uniref:Uncharacterized protein n=1 Tax=Odontella aurita TaxID=265563 RepID=A0A7S4MUG3_9STRA|mmetsp:Transcript_31754/g.95057  ORF Transcript_31754/g.95057 Transcript_31754/m.95057 type:complete len:303 (+) Transcript_31754:24-932(+)
MSTIAPLPRAPPVVTTECRREEERQQQQNADHRPFSSFPQSQPSSQQWQRHRFAAAIELNNVGASLVGRGEYCLAIEALRDAVLEASDEASPRPSSLREPQQASKQASQVHPQEDERSSDDDTESPARRTAPRPQPQPQPQPPMMSPLLYAIPVSIEEGHPHRLEEVSAVILFNLALSHHLRGEEEGRTWYLHKAAEFYRMSEAMLTRASAIATAAEIDAGYHDDMPMTTTVTASNGTEDLLTGAILNNMGQLCLSWGHHELGRQYFGQLEYLFQEDHGSSAMNVFSFNAFVAEGMNTASAA